MDNNDTLWRTIRLVLNSRGLSTEDWELVLPDALHSIRSLLCTATNETPHERFFRFPRKATYGLALPSWLLPQKQALLKKAAVSSKYEPTLEYVTLVHVNPQYARVQHADGRETTVPLRRLSSPADIDHQEVTLNTDIQHQEWRQEDGDLQPNEGSDTQVPSTTANQDHTPPSAVEPQPSIIIPSSSQDSVVVRKSSRLSKKPTYLDEYECGASFGYYETDL